MQGILYLNDTPDNQGAFTCVPGFHLKLWQWMDGLPEDAKLRELCARSAMTRPLALQARPVTW